MGWDSSSAWQTKADAIKNTTNSMIREGWTILDQASTTDGAYWAVKNKQGEQFIYCAMIQRRNDEIYIKTMTEHMGPAMNDCPMRLLSFECSVPNEYSLIWRQGVKAFHDAKEKAKALDLTGKTIELYGKTYKVLGKRKRSYFMVRQVDGQMFRLGKRQEQIVKILD